MKSQAITIDYLPRELPVRWLGDCVDISSESSIELSSFIISQAQVPVTKPKYDDLVLLFEQNKKAPNWASFSPPENYIDRGRCFNKTLIPDLNLDDTLKRYQKTLETTLVDLTSSKKLEGFFCTLEELTHLLNTIYFNTLKYKQG